jgi:hypothetical protein
MSLFAIADLHLSGGDDKPMDIFGPQWDRHDQRIEAAWRETVGPEDTVLIAGDISWAMQLERAAADLWRIGQWPGRKVICKGNHDYWWSAISRVRALLPEGMIALQHDAADLGDRVVCGTRGWMIPTEAQPLSETDEKLYRREAQRLEMALDAAERIAKGRPLWVMMHYPPLTMTDRENLFTRLLEQRRPEAVVYGHLHGAGIRAGFTGEHRGVRYILSSCDSIGFRPLRL